MVLGPRQTGKSTAAAVRVLFEAMSHYNALILLAGASGRQSGQIMEKVRQLAKSIALAILSPPSKCEGFTLANGATVVMYEGAPDYPKQDRFWAIIEKYGVTVFYTAPTAIRAFIKWGDQWPK